MPSFRFGAGPDIVAAVASAYDAFRPFSDRERSEQFRLERTLAYTVSVAGLFAGKRVLDLGASIGLHAAAAKRLGAAEAVGVDHFIYPDVAENMFTLSSQSLDPLRKTWADEGVRMVDHPFGGALPFADGSFDLVSCHAVIEHLHGIHASFFKEALRVLAPGGAMVLTTPNVASLRKRLRFLVGRPPTWDLEDYFRRGPAFTGHVREFTPSECARMLVWAGFSDVSATAGPGYFQERWAKNPKKAANLLFYAASVACPSSGELVYAVGKKKPA